MGNRKAAETVILDAVKRLDPSGKNLENTRNMLASMSDAQFDLYMQRMEREEDFISMNYENLTTSAISVENNLKVAEDVGHEFFEQIYATDASTGRTFLTPKKYIVIDLPVRRQIQMLVKKISVPDDNIHLDELTDQPTGVSKGGSLSYPEMLLLFSKGLQSSIVEFLKFRGGDLKAMDAMEKSIRETGEANIEYLSQSNTKAKATQTMSTLLKGMHLDNNF